MLAKLEKVTLPARFYDSLDTLKKSSFKWSMVFKSNPIDGTTGKISYYSTNCILPRGNVILVPGLASNTSIEPLMKAITFWALNTNYNVYCLDTFMGDFKSEVSEKYAKMNSFPELTKVIDMGLDLIQPKVVGSWTCLIAHSAGCSAIIDIFNNRIQANKKLRFSSAILFAPNVSRNWHNNMKELYKERYNLKNISNEDFENLPMGLISPHTQYEQYKRDIFISILPSFLDELDNRKFNPYVMNKWNIPITFVAGGKDRKAPIEQLKRMHCVLSKKTNGNLFKFVEFPTSKHSFIDQHKDWSAIINLIKTQRIKHRNKV